MDAPTEQGNARNARKPFDDARTEAIIAAAIEVHMTLGPGYLERVYHEALEIELERAGIPFASEVDVAVHYKEIILPATYRADVICHGDILLELKAQRIIAGLERAQVINYLKAGRIPVGLLLNFGEELLNVKRFVGPSHFQPSVP
ncbi:MAG: GxxExxY protein [Candidatus Thermoplasmatota archaeon]|jgi:GxxExxY protein